MDFARRLGHGGLVMTNLFALRSTDPRALRTATDPVGRLNDGAILVAARTSAATIAAWGVHGGQGARDQMVLSLIRRHLGIPVFCLGETKEGYPRHPLYLKATTLPRLYDALEAVRGSTGPDGDQRSRQGLEGGL
jgi:hypothetical protein